MTGLIEDGKLAAFIESKRAVNGQVVAAVVHGQVVVKLFHDSGDGKPLLMSINAKYKPISCTEDVLIQGIYQGVFPPPPSLSPKRKKK